MNRSILSLAAFALLSSLAACGGSPDSQGSTQQGAASNAPPPAQTGTRAADWSCVGNGQDRPSSLTLSTSAGEPQPEGTVALHLTEAYTHNPVGGAAIAACGAFDVACSSPLAQAQADGSGDAQIELPGSFYGYLQVTGADMPTNLVYVGGRRVGPAGLDVTVYTAAAMSMTTNMVAPSGNANGGVVRVDALDCSGAPAAGVDLTISSDGTGMTQAYFVGGGAALATDAHATDASGVSVAFGVPEGWIEVAAKRASDGRPVCGAIGYAHPGAVTSIVAMP